MVIVSCEWQEFPSDDNSLQFERIVGVSLFINSMCCQVWGITSADYSVVVRSGVTATELSGKTWMVIDVPVVSCETLSSAQDDTDSDEESLTTQPGSGEFWYLISNIVTKEQILSKCVYFSFVMLFFAMYHTGTQWYQKL